MMGGVLDGQAVSAAVTNPAFLDANGDDTGIGKITLANTDPVSGAQVDNLQQEHNSAASFMGKTLNSAFDDLPVYTNNDVGAPNDPLVDRADALTAKFNAGTGHTHTGAAGDAPPITASDLINVPLRGYVNQGTNLVGVTGGSTNVSAELSGKTAGGGTSSTGVVTTGAFNKVVLRQASGTSAGDSFEDSLGNIVYGRLTESAGVWTLTYYVDIAGTETAYSFAVSSNVAWYYQEIYNPMVSVPTFSEFAVIPSDNTTADVQTATTTLQGKVQLASSAAQSVGATNGTGTTNATVANADHTHQGVHSVSKSGDAQLFGDVTLTASGGSALTQASNNIEVSSPALTSSTPSAIASTGSVGVGTEIARNDHTHEGLHSVKLSGEPEITGDAILAVSGGTTAVQAGSTITLSSPALTISAAQSVASTNGAGAATDSARSDHTHQGVHSIAKSGSSQLFGDVTLTAGSNITLNQVGQDIEIIASFGSAAAVPVGSILAFAGGYFTAANNGGTWTDVLGNTIANVNSYIASSGFVVCDGTALNDPASPIYNGAGRFLPDLTDSRFLQGSTAAGTTGGQNSFTISANNLPTHTHPVSGNTSNNTAVVATTTVGSSTHTHSASTIATLANTFAVPIGNDWLQFNETTTASWASDIYGPINGDWTASAATGLTSAILNQGTSGTPSATTTVATSTNVPAHSHPISLTSGDNTTTNTAIENRPLYLSVFFIKRIK